jgi:predicted AAA+ superfamily ATPase
MMFPAQVVGYAKLLGQLQDSGNATTIRHYLEVLEKAFLIKLLNKFSGSKLRQRVSSPKILPLAPALLHAYSPPRRIESDASWRGRVIEMVAGVHLSQVRGQLYYWSEGDYEVDYVLKQDEKIYGIEIKSGRPRRSASMGRFLKSFPDAIPITIEGDQVEQLLLENPSEFPRLGL